MHRTLLIGVIAASLGALGAAGVAEASATFTKLPAVQMTGAAEKPAGDPDGSGSVRIFFDVPEGLACWSFSVKGIAPAAAAHIHSGAAGETGPIVIGLGAPTKGLSKGCTAASRALIRQIVANPTGFYVNVHNADFPAGALRAQLGK